MNKTTLRKNIITDLNDTKLTAKSKDEVIAIIDKYLLSKRTIIAELHADKYKDDKMIESYCKIYERYFKIDEMQTKTVNNKLVSRHLSKVAIFKRKLIEKTALKLKNDAMLIMSKDDLTDEDIKLMKSKLNESELLTNRRYLAVSDENTLYNYDDDLTEYNNAKNK